MASSFVNLLGGMPQGIVLQPGSFLGCLGCAQDRTSLCNALCY